MPRLYAPRHSGPTAYQVATPLPAARPRPSRPHLPAIDLLRVGAALALVAYHVVVTGMARRHLPALEAILWLPALGPSLTSMFIMLSGFVLYYATVDDDGRARQPARAFWRTRAANLLPVMVLGHLLMAPLTLAGSSRYAPAEAALRAVVALTANQAWVPSLAYSYDTPLWTLSALAAYFACFPALVAGARRLSGPQAVRALLAVWVVMLATTSLAYAAQARGLVALSLPELERILQTWPPLRLGEFVSGVLLARAYLARGRDAVAAPASLLVPGVVLALLLPTDWLRELPLRFVANGGLAPLWCLVIWTAAHPRLASMLAGEGARRLGRTALPIYALHFPVLSWLDVALFRGWLGAFAGAALVAYIVAMIPLGFAIDRHVVQPMAARWGRGEVRGA